ncbi:MAG: hypothetical protein CMJ59_22725 [Planctomycetaceae bacterium]|nr:hypothetical protein [Planctomycetaceae bacterium]
MLRVGGLGALGFGAGATAQRAAASGAADAKRGRARSIVFVTLYGGPPQTETFDMKPQAPLEARGPFKPISTNNPGVQICEHLPRLATLADRYTLARSFSHSDTAHAASLYTHLTGWPHRLNNQNSPASPHDNPHYGALVSRLKPPAGRVPACAIVGGRILPQFAGIGQTGGFLGKMHAPWMLSDASRQQLLSKSDLTRVRIDARRSLVEALQSKRRGLDREREVENFSTAQSRALQLLGARGFIEAFDLGREPAKVRDAYGRFPLGQNMLLARRLVEVGVPVIQVSDIPPGGEQHWDLHYANIFERLKNPLLPRLDQSVAALLRDLDQRGLLEETLVIVGGEFGRTPWIDHLTDPPQGGRQHWPHCYSMLLAGGGIRRGEVFGKSDELSAYPASHKVGPWDLGATLLHLGGIDPATTVEDREGHRRLICRGSVIRELL